MKTKAKSGRMRIQSVKKIQLSKSEFEIMREELADPEAYKRNGNLLYKLLYEDPDLLYVLFNPILLPLVMETIHKSLNTNAFMKQTVSSENEFLEQLIATLAKECEPNGILNILIVYAKKLKVKREKKTLLWAIGEFLQIVHSQRPLTESHVFRTIVLASIANSEWLFQQSQLLVSGKEPFLFDYQQVLDETFSKENWQRLFSIIGAYLRYFRTVVSFTAFRLLEQIRKPVGFRFYHVIHYPSAIKPKTSRLIVLPHETPTETPESTEEEQFEKIVEELGKDLDLYKQKDVVSEIVASIKAAAFGDINPAQLQEGLNAVVFSLLFLRRDNFFLEKLYELSGENAEKINPSDEVNYIIEIKSAPDNPSVYLQYADWLYEKGESDGAYKVYRRWLEFNLEPNETIETRMKELEEKFFKDIQIPEKAPQTVETT